MTAPTPYRYHGNCDAYDDGDYVFYSEYEKLRDENDRLKKSHTAMAVVIDQQCRKLADLEKAGEIVIQTSRNTRELADIIIKSSRDRITQLEEALRTCKSIDIGHPLGIKNKTFDEKLVATALSEKREVE